MIDSALKGLTNLPQIVIDHNEIVEIPPHKRVNHVIKKYLSTGNIVEKTRVINYFSNAIIGVVESIANPTLKTYLQTFRSGISLFELNTIFTNLIKIEDEEAEYFNKRDTMIEILKENFFKTDHVYNWDNESDQTKLIIQNIAKTPKEIAEKYNLKILAKEETTDIYSDEAIIVADLDGLMFAIHYEVTNTANMGYGSRSKEQYEFFIPWNSHEENSEPYARCMKIIDTLSKMSIEVFCHRINPEINYVTIDKFGYQIHPKKNISVNIRNINYDDLVFSMTYCLEHNKKRGIAVVGEAGVGKTQLIHKLIGHFKHVPTFIVRNEALLEVNSIRNVFNIVRDMKAILVFDDFDGLEVQEKGPITNEFLHQMDVNGDFKGIIIATVNDPSKVHYTLISRPERFDEVLLMRSPNSVEEVEEVVNNKMSSIKEDDIKESFTKNEAYLEFLAFAVENKFTHARISSAIDYSISHFSTVSGEKLLEAGKIMVEFQKTSKMFSDNGELHPADMKGIERKSNLLKAQSKIR